MQGRLRLLERGDRGREIGRRDSGERRPRGHMRASRHRDARDRSGDRRQHRGGPVPVERDGARSSGNRSAGSSRAGSSRCRIRDCCCVGDGNPSRRRRVPSRPCLRPALWVAFAALCETSTRPRPSQRGTQANERHRVVRLVRIVGLQEGIARAARPRHARDRPAPRRPPRAHRCTGSPRRPASAAPAGPRSLRSRRVHSSRTRSGTRPGPRAGGGRAGTR